MYITFIETVTVGVLMTMFVTAIFFGRRYLAARMSKPTRLNQAFELARRAHEGQTDKGGHPYINHPVRVSEQCLSEDEKIVALLHDAVEDGDVTFDEIRSLFGAKVRHAVDALTRREGETYQDFVRRCAADDLARAVKRHDIADNMDLSRLGRPATQADLLRVQKYKEALALL